MEDVFHEILQRLSPEERRKFLRSLTKRTRKESLDLIIPYLNTDPREEEIDSYLATHPHIFGVWLEKRDEERIVVSATIWRIVDGYTENPETVSLYLDGFSTISISTEKVEETDPLTYSLEDFPTDDPTITFDLVTLKRIWEKRLRDFDIDLELVKTFTSERIKEAEENIFYLLTFLYFNATIMNLERKPLYDIITKLRHMDLQGVVLTEEDRKILTDVLKNIDT